jgi:hypothetical protein
MDVERATLVICITVFVIIAINAAIYVSFRRGNQSTSIDLFRKAITRARDPWETEDRALQELSDLTSQFRNEDDNGNDYREP